MRRLAYFITVTFLFPACSDDKKKDDDPSAEISASENSEATPEDTEDTTQNGDDPLYQLGMPDYCSLETKSDKGCFTCTPRDLPLEQCFDMPNTFDASQDCNHDLDQLTCENAEFKWDFNERNQVEAMYERMPIALKVIRILIASKYKDRPKVAEHINLFMDVIDKHLFNLFSGKNIDKVASDGADAIKLIKPDLEFDKAQATESLKAILLVLEARRAEGKLNESDILTMVASMFGQLPLELGDVIGTLNSGDLSSLASDQLGGLLGADPDATDADVDKQNDEN